MKLKLRFLKLMLLLFILPLQMLAAELGEAGKLLATLPGVSDVETLKSTHFPEKYVFFIKQQLDAKDASKGSFEQRVILCHRGFDRPTVLVTEGYNAKYALREAITAMLPTIKVTRPHVSPKCEVASKHWNVRK